MQFGGKRPNSWPCVNSRDCHFSFFLQPWILSLYVCNDQFPANHLMMLGRSLVCFCWAQLSSFLHSALQTLGALSSLAPHPSLIQLRGSFWVPPPCTMGYKFSQGSICGNQSAFSIFPHLLFPHPAWCDRRSHSLTHTPYVLKTVVSYIFIWVSCFR